MHVAEIWRYPVKSMGGERLESTDIDERGLHADRLWAVRDLELGAITTGRRLPMLLGCSARFVEPPRPDAGPGRVTGVVVTLPDGEEVAGEDPAVHRRLSELTGRRVELAPLPARDDRKAYRGVFANQDDLRRQFAVPDGEPLPDLSMFPVRKLAELARYATPVGAFHDAYPVHVLTTASLAAMRARTPDSVFDVRRFRPTLVVDTGDEVGLAEFGWCGGTVTAGGVELAPEIPTIRCSMPTRAQPGLEPDPDVLRTISASADRCLGAYANVTRAGRVSVGDQVAFTPPATPGVVDAAVGRLRDGLRKGLVRASAAAMPRGRG